MDILHSILVAVHIVSAAAIVGGWFAHFRNPTVTTSQWWGSVGMIVSGVVLFGLAMSGEPNHMKLGVKFLIGVIVFVAALTYVLVNLLVDILYGVLDPRTRR